MQMLQKQGWFWLGCGVLCLTLGCGGGGEKLPDRAKVSGTVVFDGKPLANATVMFVPEGGGNPGTGTTDSSGKFQLTTYQAEDGAVIGKHKATVQWFPPESLPGAEAASVGAKPVPAKYGDVKTTPLAFEVKAGENNFSIELKE